MKNLFVRFVREEEGQDLIEYSLLAAIIAVGSIAAMSTLKDDIKGVFDEIGTKLPTNPVTP
jgi:pilus assembly protein Flp/PilA